MRQSNEMPNSLYCEILLTAQTLFQGKGFEQTTVWDISNSLQISAAQFYAYFDSLDEILDILWEGDRAIQQINRHLSGATT